MKRGAKEKWTRGVMWEIQNMRMADRERGSLAKQWGQILEAENNHQPTDSKVMRTSFLQPHTMNFINRIDDLGRWFIFRSSKRESASVTPWFQLYEIRAENQPSRHNTPLWKHTNTIQRLKCSKQLSLSVNMKWINVVCSGQNKNY